MKSFFRWLNKKGISTDAFVVVLLVIGLALAIGLVVYFGTHGTQTTTDLLNITSGLKEVSGK